MGYEYAIKQRKLEGLPRCSHCGYPLNLPKRFFFFLDRAARPGPARPCERSSLSTVRLFCSNHRCDRGQPATFISVTVDGAEVIRQVADDAAAERVMDEFFPQYKRTEPWVKERRILGGGGLTEADLIGSHRFSHTQKPPPLRGAQRRQIEEGSTEAASRGGADPRAERAAASAEDAEEEQICLEGV